MRTPLVAPTGTVITLISTTNVLPVNGSADIIALLIEQGAQTTTTAPGQAAPSAAAAGTPVHNGTVVSFTTTLGRVEPAEAKTNAGQVTVKLISDGRSGVATVTAYSGGASKTLTMNVGAAAAARISLTATPQTLPANGGTATVTAIVGDQQGNPIQGVNVTFSTSSGTLGQATGVTDSSGMTSTTVTVPPAGASTASITITATAGAGTTGTGLSGTVQLTQASRGTVTITPPSNITVGVPATFTLNVGTTVAASNVIVDFGDGDKFDLGAVSGSTAIQKTYSRVGTFTVSATAKFVDSTSTVQNTVVGVSNYTVIASCAPNTVLGSTSTFSVAVSPSGLSLDRVQWDFFGAETESGRQFGNPVTHTWQQRGTKTIQYTVIPTNAPTFSGTCQLEVT